MEKKIINLALGISLKCSLCCIYANPQLFSKELYRVLSLYPHNHPSHYLRWNDKRTKWFHIGFFGVITITKACIKCLMTCNMLKAGNCDSAVFSLYIDWEFEGVVIFFDFFWN